MRDTAPSFLRLSHVSKQVECGDQSITILRDINLTLKQGDRVAILGASGSGKTTLLTLVAGLSLPTSGEVWYRNQLLSALNEDNRTALRGKEMGFIFQDFHLLSTLNTIENVMLPLEIQYVSYTAAREKSLYWLEKVGLSKRIYHYPNQLSGGEAQRVAIARAFVHSPKLILADEMTGNLDVETGKTIISELFKLNQDENVTLLIVTHDTNLAEMCDKSFQLQNGELQSC